MPNSKKKVIVSNDSRISKGFLKTLFKSCNTNWPSFIAVIEAVGKNNKTGKFFLMLSDNTISKKCWIATQLESKLMSSGDSKLRKGNIVNVTNYSVTNFETDSGLKKKYLIITEIEKLDHEQKLQKLQIE